MVGILRKKILIIFALSLIISIFPDRSSSIASGKDHIGLSLCGLNGHMVVISLLSFLSILNFFVRINDDYIGIIVVEIIVVH